ncbi:hypothetical protein ACFZAR_32330 [Streptomyces sp. NPDC008222]|uniref:hypothetical protein n=1 Tax=Streptomyces sp. NPDC008222 TaxID=3364820 RepID=UPI0036E85173
MARRPCFTLRIKTSRWVTTYCGWFVTQVLDIKFSRGPAFAVHHGGAHHLHTPPVKQHDQPFEVIPDAVPAECLRVCDRVAFAMADAYAWNISHHGFPVHSHPSFPHIIDNMQSPVPGPYTHQLS